MNINAKTMRELATRVQTAYNPRHLQAILAMIKNAAENGITELDIDPKDDLDTALRHGGLRRALQELGFRVQVLRYGATIYW